MSTEDLLNLIRQQCDELATMGASDKWRLGYQLIQKILNLYLVQSRYEKAKILDPSFRIEFLESTKPLRETDRENIRVAVEIRKHINQHLQDLKIWTVN